MEVIGATIAPKSINLNRVAIEIKSKSPIKAIISPWFITDKKSVSTSRRSLKKNELLSDIINGFFLSIFLEHIYFEF